MRGLPKEGQCGPLTLRGEYPAKDEAATITIVAVANERWVIRKITCSYRGGIPLAAGLTVSIGGVTVWQIDLPLLDNQRPHDFDFLQGLYDKDEVNQAVVITATDPNEADTFVTLNVQYE